MKVLKGYALPEHQTWDYFVHEFKKRFIGERYMDMMQRRFEQLRQGARTVAEYESEFVRLEQYARELAPIERARCKRFIYRLNVEI